MGNVALLKTIQASVIRGDFDSPLPKDGKGSQSKNNFNPDTSNYSEPNLDGYLKYLFNFRDPTATLYEQAGRIAAIPAMLLASLIPVRCSQDKAPPGMTPQVNPPPSGEPNIGKPCAQSSDCQGVNVPLYCVTSVCVPDCHRLVHPIIVPCEPGEEVGECRVGTKEIKCVKDQLVIGECISVVRKSTETCDGKDNDCDGITDQMTETTEQGCLPGETKLRRCESGTWAEWSDCTAKPCEESEQTIERCDGRDNDCDGQIDEGLGTAVCGFGICEHTVDNCIHGAVGICNPFEGATAEVCDGLDNDCDGSTDEQEALRTTTCGLGICRHTVNNCIQGASNVCNPMEGAQDEICDHSDNDCDGLTDEGLGQITCGRGICTHTVELCINGALNFCNPLQGATIEGCNNLDDDCDGLTDEDLGQTTCGQGICNHIVNNCVTGSNNVCNPLEGSRNESCNNLDDDCDGLTDEELGRSSCGFGACENTANNCVGGRPSVCEPLPRAVPEICGDGLDNDCNGRADNGCVAVEWTKTHNGVASGDDYGWGISVDEEGNVYVSGSVTDTTDHNLDIWVQKMDRNGNEIWTRTYNGPVNGDDEAFDIAVDTNNVYVTGYESTSNEADILVRKMDKNGNTIWTHTHNGLANLSDIGTGIKVDLGGNVYVCGGQGYRWASAPESLLERSWISKLDPLGNTLWGRTDSTDIGLNSQYSDIAVDSSQNTYLTGWVGTPGESDNVLIQKRDRDGNLIWSGTLNGVSSGEDVGNGITLDEGGHIYVTGYVSEIGQNWNAFVRKMNQDGSEIWTRIYNGRANHRDQGRSIAVDVSGNVYVTGSERPGGESCNIWTRKMDRDGNTIWTQTHNGPANDCDIGTDIVVDRSGYIYVTGFEEVPGESTNVWTRKYRQIP